MARFGFTYSVEGLRTMIPLTVRVEADTHEKAIVLAHEKIKEENYFVQSGHNYTLNI